MEERDVRTPVKARCLIDLLEKKGHAAAWKFIFKLADRDLSLYRTLELHCDTERLFTLILKYIGSDAVIKRLLNEMQEMNVLSNGEVKEVKKQASRGDRISCLTSMVMRKGDVICANFLSKLAEKIPELYTFNRTRVPDLDSVKKLRRVQSKFSERVSDAVIEGLLKEMLEVKELSNEDVEEVRNTGLQPWLVEQINSGRYPGLRWTNQAPNQFQIPWKHDDRKDLTPEDTMIFKDWAVVTGRYREGIDQPDPADWRRNFQRALNKEECLVLRADRSRDPVDPHKIYWSVEILADERPKVILDKACCLIQLLEEKGPDACGKFFFKLAQRNLDLYRTLLHYYDPKKQFCKILHFIESDAVLEGLLEDIQEMKILSNREVEEIKKETSREDRISLLTRMVKWKGEAIHESFLSKLAEKVLKFYSAEWPDSDPVNRLRRVQSKFAESVSDAVIEGLLKEMLEVKVLSNEDVEDVRSAPQNTGLKPWLVEQINSGQYPSLDITNQALKQFGIPWQKDLTPEDTMIVKDWAVATGHYREGIDQSNPAVWRRNFQRALDADPRSIRVCQIIYIEEDQDGQGVNVMREERKVCMDESVCVRELWMKEPIHDHCQIADCFWEPSPFEMESQELQRVCQVLEDHWDPSPLEMESQEIEEVEVVSEVSWEPSPEYKEDKGIYDTVSENSQDDHSMCDDDKNEVTTVTTFRPVIHHEGHTRSYRFSFEKEGKYQCEITNVIFDAPSPSEVEYRTELWEKWPLEQSALLPAGPLYDIKCPSGALEHLSFPHSECSPEVQNHLMVAHQKNGNVEMIQPTEVTETHIKIKVLEMSLFGLLRIKKKSKIKGLVILFLSTLATRKKLNVFLLPSNVVLDEVKQQQEDSIFLLLPGRCYLKENESYSISCDLESARVQPDKDCFFRDYSRNFLPTFCIIFNNDEIDLALHLFKCSDRNTAIWTCSVPLDVSRSSAHSNTSPLVPASPDQRLLAVRTRFVEGINNAVIKGLLDDMLEMKVLNDGEVEEVKEGQTVTSDKARCLIDMVRRKGSASSEKLLCKLAERDASFYRALGLHW